MRGEVKVNECQLILLSLQYGKGFETVKENVSR